MLYNYVIDCVYLKIKIWYVIVVHVHYLAQVKNVKRTCEMALITVSNNKHSNARVSLKWLDV